MRYVVLLVAIFASSLAMAQGRSGAAPGAGVAGGVGGGAGAGAGIGGGMSAPGLSGGGGASGLAGAAGGNFVGGGMSFGLGTAGSHVPSQAAGPIGAISNGTPGPDLGKSVSESTFGATKPPTTSVAPERPNLKNTSKGVLAGPL